MDAAVSVTTRSPTLHSVTSTPTAAITPADSCPSVTGSLPRELVLCELCQMWMSDPQTPTVCTRTSTVLGWRVGISSSLTSSALSSSANLTSSFISDPHAQAQSNRPSDPMSLCSGLNP